ncbi:MAG: type II restriction endonuclease [Desulfovibrionaceae bacterium]|nr:type II restriction endonuclease [Desulfovibrionaceae bacterium]
MRQDTDFKTWLAGMRPSINGYGYYADFQKIYANVEAVKVELCIMNSLIGSSDIEDDFKKLLARFPDILRCIPILLAVRTSEIYAQDEDGAFEYDFGSKKFSDEQYAAFMRKTGLFDLISGHIVNNLIDYCLGIETGLDSNGRKNRGGHQMEDLVEGFLARAGASYHKEMYLQEIEEQWGVDMSAISADGKSTKRWDFVVRAEDAIYVIETNFYASSGSKLNETARSYKMIAEEMKTVQGVEFVWVTDGGGWKNARGNLEETFGVMDHIYNIRDLENGVFDRLFRA